MAASAVTATLGIAGFLKCGDCGRALTKKNYKNSRGESYYTFQCGTYVRTGNQFCTSHYIKEDVLKHIVLDDLNQIIANITNLVEILNDAQEKSRQSYKKEMYETLLKKNELAISRVRKLKKKVFEEYALGAINSDEYKEYREQYISEEINLEHEKELILSRQNQK